MESLRSLWRHFKGKMVGDPLPPEDVAAGWALGVFIGCSIPFGAQLVIAVPLAMMMRVSKLGATLGTLVTNPVSIFVVYPAQTYLANKLFFGGSLAFSKLLQTEWTRESVRRLGAETIASFFLGGILLAIVLTPIAYFTVRHVVISQRSRRARLKDTGC
jgi:uncharacterized protein (DUF2062 family)